MSNKTLLNQSNTSSPILIFGGSFDPPHKAHITLPQHVARITKATTILYIPAGNPPHKSRMMTPANHRVAMLELALTDYPQSQIITCEIDRGGTSYTYDTLQHLKAIFPSNQQFRLLIGADMAASFYSWYKPNEIIELAEPIVMIRPPYKPEDILKKLPTDLSILERDSWKSRIIPIDQIPVSSTEIRTLLKEKPNTPELSELLHPEVLSYIQDHKLYS